MRIEKISYTFPEQELTEKSTQQGRGNFRERSPKNYSKELRNSEHCGIVIERDVNPGINI